ncbi:hypothetical protein [Vibrio europaeus]|uniref:hypothetical protein n=1 Tax=Vibrio europaeus TaxID=300876 RepID=UPI00233EDAC6|nr:hypothetical protein [Vibrio europaeus]MDC5753570.1 hypothetical protein [Vibrio europaeus]MDC5816518.1 hypothetical protein [Vibrio europaeus]
MFEAMGTVVTYKGQECKVIGFAPASKVNCGTDYAYLLSTEEGAKYVNTKDIANDE